MERGDLEKFMPFRAKPLNSILDLKEKLAKHLAKNGIELPVNKITFKTQNGFDLKNETTVAANNLVNKVVIECHLKERGGIKN